ncbi:hypothetical protein FM117_09090 [Micrococcus luteus Mu201]|nr:hypothetical protein FM117_09090 [Micrococcus luteus Mu201]
MAGEGRLRAVLRFGTWCRACGPDDVSSGPQAVGSWLHAAPQVCAWLSPGDAVVTSRLRAPTSSNAHHVKVPDATAKAIRMIGYGLQSTRGSTIKPTAMARSRAAMRGVDRRGRSRSRQSRVRNATTHRAGRITQIPWAVPRAPAEARVAPRNTAVRIRQTSMISSFLRTGGVINLAGGQHP